MRYIDTASRKANDALGFWLHRLIGQSITDFRIQSGYFAAQGITPLACLFQYLAARDMPTTCVVGSNDGETIAEDIQTLIEFVGCPRKNARIAIIRYGTGLYHPKLYHATRANGSQTAYVGSANLTSPGVSGLNIEAGLILDTADGDPEAPLTEIASAVDIWFNKFEDSVNVVRNADDIHKLVNAGILTPHEERLRRLASSAPHGRQVVRLKPLISFSALPPNSSGSVRSSEPTSARRTEGAALGVMTPELEEGDTEPPAFPPVRRTEAWDYLTHEEGDTEPSAFPLSVPRKDMAPPYVLFDPDATKPTQGAEALTCSFLPSGMTGLIVQLNRDSARHFQDKAGTANVSIPVCTIGTLRFGVFEGRHMRPRCEFSLRMRYVNDTVRSLCEQSANTNVMVYGHAAEESGHGDVRLLLPRHPVRAICKFASRIRSQVPAVDDPMILEWPTSVDPCFKVTFADPNSEVSRALRDAFTKATQLKQLVGKGACWFSSDEVALPDWDPVFVSE